MKAYGRVLFTIPALLLAIPVFAQEARGTAVIWHDRGDAAALDVVSGAGGKDHEPGTDFRFIEESQSGTSAKFVVEDERAPRGRSNSGKRRSQKLPQHVCSGPQATLSMRIITGHTSGSSD
jgi:hypothetical protein